MVKRYAIIEGGKVVNVAVAEPEFAAEQGWIEAPAEVGPGFLFDGEAFMPAPPDLDALAAAARAERDRRLREEVDPVVTNPLRWNAMTAEQQQAWADYRQALLDMPQQSGFPLEINWPTMPA